MYERSDENFPNPERGFYFPFDPLGLDAKDFVYPLSIAQLQEVRNQNLTLVRRIYLISEFRDQPISESFLNMISNDCESARKAGIKMIIRFSYNWLHGGPDASTDRILSHLDQLKPVLQTNHDVIAYMEAGFIGFWGEWHDSSNGLLPPDGSTVTDDARKILLKILSVLPDDRMVAIRYPRYKKQILNNNNSLTSQETFDGSAQARIGYHNDGFRSNIDDAGTYVNTDSVNVNEEKIWLNLDTTYVVQGGEPAWVSTYPPGYDDCEGALTDFARMHWSGMNVDQADPAAKPVYQTWINQGCMEEIKRRLGYRFRLTKSVIPARVKPGSTFFMEFEIANDGWASPYNPRKLEVILRNNETQQEYYLPVNENPRMWMPNTTHLVKIRGCIPASIPLGSYEILLNLPDPTTELYNHPEYSIRLANQNVWEKDTGYNSLFKSIVIDTDEPGIDDCGNDLLIFRKK
ncbi:MAG: DUF4832 domain-containing protein [Stigonema ocellatum SAG 48.90 = DSM 106950]|nr:DUF4832 domain-containing protein [Stigonema ocellatum SAG 48.90 = DSM 106950]